MRLFAAIILCLSSALAGAADDGPIDISNSPAVDPAVIAAKAKERQAFVADVTALGRRMFFDRGLSASGKLACASCHSPDHAYGPPNNLAVQLGGAGMKLSGTRAVPSLRYLQTMPSFTEHYIEEDLNGGADNGPTGGHTADGRAGSLHEQASIPLLSRHEMANGDAATFLSRLKKSAYAGEFRRLFGDAALANADQALLDATTALEYFQQVPEEFYPYSSKYDAFLRGKVQLSTQEIRGMALFMSPEKGNCASCHNNQIGYTGAFPQFTDYGYAVVAAPRNLAIPANRDPKYYDMGLCGPERKDLTAAAEYCGMFKVPSLRNTALRKSYFHNGVLHRLDDVVTFYVDRDIHPARWYGRDARGKARRYDDLPAKYHENVEKEAPFDRSPGEAPRLSRQEIRDVVAFMKTLNDGYTAKAPAAKK